MRPAERAFPVRMRRVAVVAPRHRVRDVLVAMAQLGVIDLSGPFGTRPKRAQDECRRHAGRRRTQRRT